MKIPLVILWADVSPLETIDVSHICWCSCLEGQRFFWSRSLLVGKVWKEQIFRWTPQWNQKGLWTPDETSHFHFGTKLRWKKNNIFSFLDDLSPPRQGNVPNVARHRRELWAQRPGLKLLAMWCPRSIAKLVHITLISLGLMVDISIVNGIINQLITGGAPPCVDDSIVPIYNEILFRYVTLW